MVFVALAYVFCRQGGEDDPGERLNTQGELMMVVIGSSLCSDVAEIIASLSSSSALYLVGLRAIR